MPTERAGPLAPVFNQGESQPISGVARGRRGVSHVQTIGLDTPETPLPLALGGVRWGSNSESESEARATAGPE
eukprot:1673425-Pleurochrysis_carterae.AAC.1